MHSALSPIIVIAPTEADMVLWGRTFGNLVDSMLRQQAQLVVFLEGHLGIGKTTLVRGVMAGLGYCGNVKSPTYTLVEPYAFAHTTANHFDLYRLGHPEELEFLGIRDYFCAASVTLIEWPNKGAGMLPPPDVTIAITNVDGLASQRRLHVSAHSLQAQELLHCLEATAHA